MNRDNVLFALGILFLLMDLIGNTYAVFFSERNYTAGMLVFTGLLFFVGVLFADLGVRSPGGGK